MAKKAKLHEIVAVGSGRKAAVQKTVTALYHILDKGDLFDGHQRIYTPRDETGEQMPPERKNPQQRVDTLVAQAAGEWAGLFNLVATQDAGNMKASADVVLTDDTVLATGLSVPTLLFLEKQLGDVKAFIDRLPTPDLAERWLADPNSGCLVTEPVKTVRTKKVEDFVVTVVATPEHPAQVQKVTKDDNVGTWTTIKQTTKIPAADKAAMQRRVDLLLTAVKEARQRANSVEVEKETKLGKSLLGFVFGDFAKDIDAATAAANPK